MSMSDYDKKNVGKIIRGHGDWFTARLFRLICVADDKNRAKLFKAFPDEVDVVHKYKTGEAYEALEAMEDLQEQLADLDAKVKKALRRESPDFL